MALNGIDTSNWQSGIDLDVVPYDFVIAKATQGKTYVSPDCARQVEQVRARGKLFGVYHYIDGSGAIGEADFFIDSVENWVGEGILCLDWESNQNAAWGNEDYLRQVAQRVIDRTGIPPIIYVQKSRMAQVKKVADALNCGLWIAQYADMKATGYQDAPWNEGAYSCAIRQYSSCGRLSGYSGNLDLNKAYMDAAAWKRYANPKGEASPGGATGTVSGGGSGSSSTSGSGGVTPSGSTLDLVYHVLKNGLNGDAREEYCGTRFREVQDFINHIYDASDQTLAEEVRSGRYGNDPVRKTVLDACGGRYQAVQDIINGKSRTYTVKSGDTLSGIGAKLGVSWKDIASENGIPAPPPVRSPMSATPDRPCMYIANELAALNVRRLVSTATGFCQRNEANGSIHSGCGSEKSPCPGPVLWRI